MTSQNLDPCLTSWVAVQWNPIKLEQVVQVLTLPWAFTANKLLLEQNSSNVAHRPNRCLTDIQLLFTMRAISDQWNNNKLQGQCLQFRAIITGPGRVSRWHQWITEAWLRKSIYLRLSQEICRTWDSKCHVHHPLHQHQVCGQLCTIRYSNLNPHCMNYFIIQQFFQSKWPKPIHFSLHYPNFCIIRSF